MLAATAVSRHSCTTLSTYTSHRETRQTLNRPDAPAWPTATTAPDSCTCPSDAWSSVHSEMFVRIPDVPGMQVGSCQGHTHTHARTHTCTHTAQVHSAHIHVKAHCLHSCACEHKRVFACAHGTRVHRCLHTCVYTNIRVHEHACVLSLVPVHYSHGAHAVTYTR